MAHLLWRLLGDRGGRVLHVSGRPAHALLGEVGRGVRLEGVCVDLEAVEHLRRTTSDVTWWHADPVTMQLPHQFDVVVLSDALVANVPAQHRRSLVHNVVQHLLPGGVLVASFEVPNGRETFTVDEFDELCADCDLEPMESHDERSPDEGAGDRSTVVVRRRTHRFTVHDLVYEARRTFPRLSPDELWAQLRGPRSPVVIDTRTHTDRARFGVIAGSIHVPRTVLEWHLDPANGYRHPAVTSLDQALVVVCNRGYSSSLGAASLVRLGFTSVCDLVGGVQSWIDHGFPVVPADHDHLDL